MDTKATVVGSHARFFRDGDAFTNPSAGTASRTAKPGSADTGWLDLGPIMDAGVEKKADVKEVWAPNPGRIALHDVVETKREIIHRFIVQELSPHVMEILYGTEALDEDSTTFTALDGETKKGWLEIKQYDQDDNLLNTVYSYCYLAITGEVKLGAEIVSPQFEARQLISTLNSGTLVAS